MGDGGGFVAEGPGFAEGLPDGAVVSLVGFAEVWGHEEGVVEVGVGAVWLVGAGIEDGLGGLLDLGG